VFATRKKPQHANRIGVIDGLAQSVTIDGHDGVRR
jgi:hypothetical protein